jgi:glycosyltransferase involved in cell wall biosynthesis
MISNPLVTVIALSYNQRPYVLDFLKSVEGQNYNHLQVIITDDNSTDGSKEAIHQFCLSSSLNVQLICHTSNQGINKTLNEALKLAEGQFIAISAVDDLWHSDKIKEQVKVFTQLDESVGVLYSDAYLIDKEGASLPGLFIERHRHFNVLPQGNILEELLQGNFIPAPSVLIRASALKKTGAYDETLCYEDWDMWLRMARHYDFACHPSILTSYRIIPSSLTHQLKINPLPLLKTHYNMHIKWLSWQELSKNQKKEIRLSLSTLAWAINHEDMLDCNKTNRRKHLIRTLMVHRHFKTVAYYILTFFPFEKKVYKILKNVMKLVLIKKGVK